MQINKLNKKEKKKEKEKKHKINLEIRFYCEVGDLFCFE